MKKPVDVRPVLSAQLPEGYKIDKYVVQPSSVEIKGSRIRLGVMSSIPTETIYITENSLNQNFDVPLNMDDFWGVELTEKISTVHVEVSLKGPSKTKVIQNIPIRLRVGTGSKSKAVDAELKRIQLRPNRVNITVEGAETALQELDEKSMEVWVQVPQLKSGNQRARLSWKISPDVRILQRSTDTVVVNVP